MNSSLFAWSNTVLTLLTLALSACSTWQRSPESGYGFERRSSVTDRKSREMMEVSTAAQELGLYNTSDLSSNQREALRLRRLLRKLEKNLVSQRERNQYFNHRSHMRGDKQRVEFLLLDSYEARERWIQSKTQGQAWEHPPEIKVLIDESDITTGMTKQAVREAWGEPEAVEVAGNPMYGNERWQYSEQVSSTEGYLTESRIVYFESGRVAGWEKR